MPLSVRAITINIEYSTDTTGEENPSWDENGLFLIGHFQAAKQIWESLLPGPGEISFDFQWDDDIDGLGLTTKNGIDDYIEIHPNNPWYVDPTPGDSAEFSFADTVDGMGNPRFYQRFYNQLSASDQSTYFPDTPPPGSLEVMYRGFGLTTATSASMQTTTDSMNNTVPVTARNGNDLLSTIVHEMGHMLGILGVEPGHYNTLPQHVGGLEDVNVLDTSEGGGHLAGNPEVPGFLMCASCGQAGVRRFPSATDVLVNALEQDITDVKLARVARISAGNWNDTNAWIGADVPDATQDAYVRQGGAVTLDVNANVKSLSVSGGSSVDAAGFQLVSASDLRLAGGSLSVGTGGKVSAVNIQYDLGTLSAGAGGTFSVDSFHGDPATLSTAAGSTVEFNDFTRGASSATAATFNGNVKIGVGDGGELVTFNPNAIATWNIGQNLTVGNFQRPAKLEIDNGVWTVGGNLSLVKGAVIVDAGNGINGGRLDVTGSVAIGEDQKGAGLIYRGSDVSNTTYTIYGGSANIDHEPPMPPKLKYFPGGQLTFEETSGGNFASADSTTFVVTGGVGDGADRGVVTFKGDSRATNAQIETKPGGAGVSLRISNPTMIAGKGGLVAFEDNSYAQGGLYSNYGVDAHGAADSGGATHFYDDSYTSGATFDNYGATLQSYSGVVSAPGGRTAFFDKATAPSGVFNNHSGQGMGSLGAGITVFNGESNAGSALNPAFNTTYNNLGGAPGKQHGGAVEFYGIATAGKAIFYNQHAVGVTQHAGSAGNVRFYGNSTAENATFYNQVGGGAVFFNDNSTAGDAHFFIEDTGTATFGGHVVFNGNSNAGTADITVRENAFSSTVEFRGTSNADRAEITLVNGWHGSMLVYNSASLGNATVDVGATNGGGLQFRDSATAANSTIRIRQGSSANFTGANTTAANATFTLDGATVSNGGVGSLFFTGANAGNATIYVNGGTVFNAAGAQLSISSGSNAGTATIIGGSAAVPGAGGGRITIDASSNLSNATLSVGAGGFLAINGFGAARVGSLDVTGTASIFLQQAELRVGGLNTLNFINGPITGFVNNGNAKLTKVGINLLELNGANTYYGLTKVDGGTLAINGSTPGAVEVNTGAIFKGRGTIGGTVTVNAGGKFAPGNSVIDAPSIITIGGLAMTSAGTLDFELGPASYDRIIAGGSMALAGALQVSLINGFTPAAGQSFNLFDWGSVSGTFSSLTLPTLSGLNWNTSQLYTTGVLSVAASIPGDFNQDTVVDARDYIVWRKSGGTQASYDTWRANFGQTSGSGSIASSSIPEPASAVLFLGTLAMCSVSRRCRRTRPDGHRLVLLPAFLICFGSH